MENLNYNQKLYNYYVDQYDFIDLKHAEGIDEFLEAAENLNVPLPEMIPTRQELIKYYSKWPQLEKRLDLLLNN